MPDHFCKTKTRGLQHRGRVAANSHRSARHDETVLSVSRPLRFGGVNWIPDNSRLSPTENLRSEHIQSNRTIYTRHDTDRTVLSRLADGVNWTLAKLVRENCC